MNVSQVALDRDLGASVKLLDQTYGGIEQLGLERGHRALLVHRKAGRPSPPIRARDSTSS